MPLLQQQAQRQQSTQRGDEGLLTAADSLLSSPVLVCALAQSHLDVHFSPQETSLISLLPIPNPAGVGLMPFFRFFVPLPLDGSPHRGLVMKWNRGKKQGDRGVDLDDVSRDGL